MSRAPTMPCTACRKEAEVRGWAEHSGYIYECAECGHIRMERRVGDMIYRDDTAPMKRKKK